jgi:hypothetical protein
MQNLVIGKNSKIVQALKNHLDNHHVISHTEIHSIDIQKYRKVFLFSWNKKDHYQNLVLLKDFELSRVVFISTIAVLSLAKRHQWAAYPNAKAKCEAMVLEGGGSIIRIGVWDAENLANFYGTVPVTKIHQLIDAMRHAENHIGGVIQPVECHEGLQRGIRRHLGKLLNRISDSLPAKALFQVPIAVLLKYMGIGRYSYTNDCLEFFSDRTIVGYGAIGSKISKYLRKCNRPHTILVSGQKNRLLNTHGFVGTRIGQDKIGLSKFWHGVYIDNTNGSYFKKVPLFVSRPRLPRQAKVLHVKSLRFDDGLFTLELDENLDIPIFYTSNIVHLAAGCVNNARILSESLKENILFSDHEVGIIGSVDTSELLNHGYLQKLGPFVTGRKIFVERKDSKNYMLDFRTKSSFFGVRHNKNIFNNTTAKIFFRLLVAFNIRDINQAVFNKFGVGIHTKSFEVWLQIEARNCIVLDTSGSINRTRLCSKAIDDVCSDVKQRFKTFRQKKDIETFDGIHLHSHLDLVGNSQLIQLIVSKKLFLHGISLSPDELGPFHNTRRAVNKELSLIEEN